jgi:hypothetical protein
MEEALWRKPYKRLSRDELLEIVRLHGEGIPVSFLAVQFQSSERQLHRIVKDQAAGPVAQTDTDERCNRRMQPFLQEFHSAWIYEELVANPHISMDLIADGLRTYFNIDVSNSTIWRHIKGGTLERHGFPGYTRLRPR